MPDICLDLSDAIELAEMLEFIAQWLSSGQQQNLADSFAAFMGPNTTYTTEGLRADLHRFVFLLGVSDGEDLFSDLKP